MNKMKKILSLALAMALGLSLMSGCSKKEEPEQTPEEPVLVDLTTVTDPVEFAFGVPSDTVVATSGETPITAGMLAYFGTNGMMARFMVDLPVALIAVAAAAVYGVSCLISIGICKRKNG